jgi:hypothetical protein
MGALANFSSIFAIGAFCRPLGDNVQSTLAQEARKRFLSPDDGNMSGLAKSAEPPLGGCFIEGMSERTHRGASSRSKCMQARDLEEEGMALACQLQHLLLSRDKTTSSLDLKALAIIQGVACWNLFIDCIVLCHGGSLLTTLSAAIHKALQSTSIPKTLVDASIEDATVEDIEVDANMFARQTIDTSHLPVIVTVCQVRFPNRSSQSACCAYQSFLQ